MKHKILAVLIYTAIFPLLAAEPKTDVVIETIHDILLHVEYISENENASVVDVRDAIFPAALCDASDLPRYIPKKGFDLMTKLSSGHCLYKGNPFVVKSMTIVPADIKKRYDTALITLSNDSEKKQMPFFGTSGDAAWGFNLRAEPPVGRVPPGVGLIAFPMNKTMDTIQTVDIAGERTSLYPHHNLFHKWSKLDPRLAVYYSPLMPTGAISILNFGALGVTVENSIAVPDFKFMPLKKFNLRLRGGINAGYHGFSQDLFQNEQAVATGKITLIPVLFQLTLYWDIKPRGMNVTFSPYVRLADGVVFSSVSTQLKSEFIPLLNPASAADVSRSGSFIGNGFQAALGFEIRPAKWPVTFLLDGGYFMHSQDLTGSYFVFNGGVAWHYGSSPPDPKMLPITYLGQKSVVLNLGGDVKAPDGAALSGADVVLFAKGSSAVVKQTTTTAKGQYSMEVDPGLDYTVEVRKDGYAKSVQELPLLSNDKKVKDMDFILAPLTYSLEGVNFKPDSDQLVDKAAEKSILELVKFLEANPGLRIEIGGHTAASGADDANSRKISKMRAETVRKFLINKGIAESRLTSEGYGGSAPIADGKTAAGAAMNRRVEVKILTE